MLSALFVVSKKGYTLVSKIYRDVPADIIEVFKFEILASREIQVPLKCIRKYSFLFIEEGDVYVVAITTENSDAAVIFEIIMSFVKNCKIYFDEFSEESIKNNFLLIYEILEEIMDYGYPQITDPDSLKIFITQKIHDLYKLNSPATNNLTSHTTGSTPWRLPGIYYDINRAYFDVIESVNVLVSSTGTVLHAEVLGKIIMKSLLSGMPECQLLMNDNLLLDNKDLKTSCNSILLEDLNFHQCVKLNKFETDRTISFIPPNGEFELLNYRATDNVSMPFRINSNIKEVSKNLVRVEVSVKSNFDPSFYGKKVCITIPTPGNTAVVKILSRNGGKVCYKPEINAILWRISKFSGGLELTLRANAELLNETLAKRNWSRPPIYMEFTIPMFTTSRLKITYLNVIEKSRYPVYNYVKYVTKAGSYLNKI